MRKRALLALGCLLGLSAFRVISADTAKKNAAEAREFLKQIPNSDRITQVLNRLTYGPRPGDAAQVRTLGVKKWIDLQLNPDRIPESPVLEGKLKFMDTLSMPSDQLVQNYPTPQLVKQMVAGQIP